MKSLIHYLSMCLNQHFREEVGTTLRKTHYSSNSVVLYIRINCPNYWNYNSQKHYFHIISTAFLIYNNLKMKMFPVIIFLLSATLKKIRQYLNSREVAMNLPSLNHSKLSQAIWTMRNEIGFSNRILARRTIKSVYEWTSK